MDTERLKTFLREFVLARPAVFFASLIMVFSIILPFLHWGSGRFEYSWTVLSSFFMGSEDMIRATINLTGINDNARIRNYAYYMDVGAAMQKANILIPILAGWIIFREYVGGVRLWTVRIAGFVMIAVLLAPPTAFLEFSNSLRGMKFGGSLGIAWYLIMLTAIALILASWRLIPSPTGQRMGQSKT